MSLANSILKDNINAKHTTGAELSALVRKYFRCKDADKKSDLREQVFNNSIRMIRKATIKVVGAQSDFLEDAFQSACIAFFHGLDKYKPRKNIAFSTYIYFWIVKGVKDEYYSRNTIKIGRELFKKDNFAQFRNDNLVQIDGLNSALGEDGMSDHSKYLKDTRADTAKDIDNIDAATHLEKLLDKNLTAFEAGILRLRYLYDEKPSFVELGRRLGMSHQSIQATESTALSKMRRLLRDGYTGVSYYRCRKHPSLSDGLDKIYTDIINSRPVRNVISRAERRRKS